MFCNFSGMFSLPDYARAKAHFEATPLPGNTRRGALIWESNQRPLDGVRKWHVRVERKAREGQETYSLWLYHTEMVRYYPPGGDGFARVLIQHDGRNASSQFMWRSGWSTRAVGREDINGNSIIVPLGHVARNTATGDVQAADLYVCQRTVDTARSWHAPIAYKATSAERRKERREVLKPVEHILRFAAEAHQSGYFHRYVRMCAGQMQAAIAGDVEAQATLMEWALSRNTSDLRGIKRALLAELGLYTMDEIVPIPQFPTRNEWAHLNMRKIVSQ